MTQSHPNYIQSCALTWNRCGEGRITDFRIVAGVLGSTGVGKSSLLNALLDIPDLLPSSHTEAGTATVCQLAWNHSDAPDTAFRAQIIFRSEDSVRKELSLVLGALEERKNIDTILSKNQKTKFRS